MSSAQPLHVAAWIELQTDLLSAPTVKQENGRSGANGGKARWAWVKKSARRPSIQGLHSLVCAMRYIPIRDQHLTILARDSDAWRARAERRFDVEALIWACVPDAATCDPRIVADAIREWFDSFDDDIPT